MVPAKFGRYEIKSELGRGGMATVFHAYDPRFRRDVALKVLPREFLHDPTFKVRFEREAQTIAALEHPAIVPVYDFGEQDGQPYLVMRFLTGGTLDDRLQYGELANTEAIRVIEHLAPAIDEAHERGIIHRDLKPANILFDGRGAPYITDFGIAKLSLSSERLTSGQVIIGTPDYMSPEQASGEKLDGRSDIYALGVIIFELLTGKLPYSAETPVGLLMKHISEPVPNILSFKSDLPPACKNVINRAMAKNRANRYATAAGLAAAFAQALNQAVPSEPEIPLAASQPEIEPAVRDSSPQQSKVLLTPAGSGLRVQNLACPNCGAPLPNNLQPNQQIACDSCGSRFIMADSESSETIICPNCQTANSAEIHYCSKCGQRLYLDCVRCHTRNRVDATHCSKCGINLESAQAQRHELNSVRQRRQREREQALVAKEMRQQQEKIERLLKELEQPARHQMAIYQLNQIGSEALPGVIETLLNRNRTGLARSGSARVVDQICKQRQVKGLIKARAAKALIKALADPEPEVRRAAAAALGQFKGQPGQMAVEPLGALLRDRNEEVRQQARESLHEIGGKRALEILDKSTGFMGWLRGS